MEAQIVHHLSLFVHLDRGQFREAYHAHLVLWALMRPLKGLKLVFNAPRGIINLHLPRLHVFYALLGTICHPKVLAPVGYVPLVLFQTSQVQRHVTIVLWDPLTLKLASGSVTAARLDTEQRVWAPPLASSSLTPIAPEHLRILVHSYLCDIV